MIKDRVKRYYLANAVIFLLLFNPLLLSAQKKVGKAFADSLLIELPKARADTNKVKLLIVLSQTFYSIDLGEAVKYAQQALEQAESMPYDNITARACNTLGGACSLSGNVQEALKNHGRALALYKKTGYKKGIGDTYVFMGNCYYNEGVYPEALNNFFAASKIYEQVGNKPGEIMCYNNIGSIYRAQKNYEEALKNFSAGMKMVEAAGDKNATATYLQNIGNIYMDEGNYTESIKYALEALKIYEETGDKNGIAGAYNNIGANYTLQHKYADAINKISVASRLFEEVGNRRNFVTSLGDIGVDFYELKQYKKAEEYFSKQLAIARAIESLQQVNEAYDHLRELYEREGDYKKALVAYKAFVTTRDSMFNEENTRKTVRSQMQYDFDKKESIARADEARKEAEVGLKLQRKNIIIYGACSAFIALAVIGMLLFRQNKLRTNQQKAVLEQKQLRAQMNPHFIFNCLNSIQHFVVANDVKNANKYLSGFALLMRQTLENSKQGVVTLRREIEYLENYLELEAMRFEDKFSYSIACGAELNKDTIEIPAMIIQPFIENAIRHGLCYLEQRKGMLKISFYRNGNYLYCEVDDNGIGREESRRLKLRSEMVYESHGMELTRQRLALVSKSVGTEYKLEIIDKRNAALEAEGTTIIIKFPLES